MSDLTPLRKIVDGLERLASIARNQLDAGEADFEQLVAEYVPIKKEVARSFQALATEQLATEEPALQAVRRQVTHRLREVYGGRVPDRYLQVRGYQGMHLILYEYLIRHLGEPVPASRLRVLTGDQVHTERRVRELRDLGLPIRSTRTADEDHYVLEAAQADVDLAADVLVKHNIQNDRKISKVKAAELLAALDEQSTRA